MNSLVALCAKRNLLLGVGLLVGVLGSIGITMLGSPYHAPPSTPGQALAQQDSAQTQYSYFRATVLAAHYTKQADVQRLQVRLLDGPQTGTTTWIEHTAVNFGDAAHKLIPVDSQILLAKDSATNQYTYVDRYRIPGATTLLLLLVGLVVLIARLRGIASMVGLATSILVVAWFIIPRIIAGHDAYLTCIQGALLIAAASMFIAHGLHKRTVIAFVGAISTLTLAIAITSFSRYATGLSGFAGEESVGIAYAQQHISLAGLLFGGIIIASLGVLNDITIGQAAAIDQIHRVNPGQTSLQLYKRGMAVGREHIAALVNTLALAYVGVALPAVVTTALYNHAPLLVILNNELVMEEIVRTAIVSISLLLAVPVTTVLAAYLLPRWDDQFDASVTKWLRGLW